MLLFSKNIIYRFCAIFLICLLAVYFISDVFSCKWTDLRYCFFLTLLISFISLFYKRDISFWFKCITIFFVTGLSVPILWKLSNDVSMLGSFVWDELSTGLSILLLFLILRILLELLVNGYKFTKVVFCTVLELLLLFPYFLFFAYYFVIGDIVDVNSIIALYQTNFSEVLEFLSDSITLVLGIVLVIYLYVWIFFLYTVNLHLSFDNFKFDFRINIFLLVISVIASILFCKVSNFTYFNRIMFESLDYIKSVSDYELNRIDAAGKFRHIDVKADLSLVPDDAVFLVVIGESQNKNHMGVYGYERNTTPWLTSKRDIGDFIFLNNAYACHTLTMKALSNALTECNQYNKKKFVDSYSLVDLAKSVGFKTYWISNQGKFGTFSSPVSVMAAMADYKIWLNPDDRTGNVYDEEIIKALSEVTNENGRKVVFIHLMGNHWEYSNRYPDSFKGFNSLNDMVTSKAKNVSKLNEYDTSMLYNDFVIQKIFEYAKYNWNLYNMVYFSDHGEAVMSNNKHIPSKFEDDMVEIPVYLYFSDVYKKNNPLKYRFIKENVDVFFTNDLMFNAILNVWNFDTVFYDSKYDFLSNDYILKKNELKSLDGSIKLF